MVTDGEGAVITEGPLMGGGSAFDYAAFAVDLGYEVDHTQLGELILLDYSEADGSVIELRETAIWLGP